MKSKCPVGYYMSENGVCIENNNTPFEDMNCDECHDQCMNDFWDCTGCDSYPKHGCTCTYVDMGNHWDNLYCCHGNHGDHQQCMQNCADLCMNTGGPRGGSGGGRWGTPPPPHRSGGKVRRGRRKG
tara:strand:+ start:3988 stop:4365 length:378 start_codon:yes stop_codon:yes gene_type:complete